MALRCTLLLVLLPLALSSEVVTLTDENFDEYLASGEGWLVTFSAPYVILLLPLVTAGCIYKQVVHILQTPDADLGGFGSPGQRKGVRM